MKALYDVAAPAKLNLFLHVLGRRADGFHRLQSVFMLIDWCDTLYFELRQDGKLSREDLGAALPEDDLILRAARLLQQTSGTPLGAHIGVAKSIPFEAGLGGGSSDAASCLLALNRLWRLGLSRSQLSHLGLSLGADVPFFLGGCNAWVEGVGEQLTPIDLPAAPFVVVKPREGVSTRAIFASEDLCRSSPAAIISGFAAHRRATGDDFGLDFGHNDLQPVAERLCPSITQAVDWLGAQGLAARMTGSGSSVFARLPHEAELAAAPSGWQVRRCSSLVRHPLMEWADQEAGSFGIPVRHI